MMATVMNALALKDAFETLGIKARVQSALSMQQIAETYARPKAIQYLEEGKVVIFAAGTGNPFFTTDTAAALRGAEMNCDVMLKATNVDGVYTADPKKDPTATRYETITFDEALLKNLKVMDATAFALCRERKLNIVVFGIAKEVASHSDHEWAQVGNYMFKLCVCHIYLIYCSVRKKLSVRTRFFLLPC